MLHRLHDQLGERLGVERRAAGHERGARGDREGQRVERRLEVAPRGGGRLLVGERRRRDLALGEAVDLVVHHQVGDVDVAAGGVREVARADGEAVAVAADRDDVEVGVGELHAHRHRQRAPVQAVEAVRRYEARQAAGAADAGDDDGLRGVEVELGERPVERGEDAEVTAARAPDRLQVRLVVGGLALGGSGAQLGILSMMTSRTSSAVNGRPSHLAWLSTCEAALAAHEARELAGEVDLGDDDARGLGGEGARPGRPGTARAPAGRRRRPRRPRPGPGRPPRARRRRWSRSR